MNSSVPESISKGTSGKSGSRLNPNTVSPSTSDIEAVAISCLDVWSSSRSTVDGDTVIAGKDNAEKISK